MAERKRKQDQDDDLDLVEVGAEALQLGQEIASALKVDSEGGRKITRGERKKILQDILTLATHLVDAAF